MYSMTGFGRTVTKTRLGKLTAEISSVNNRFLEFSIRLPRPYMSLEPNARELLTGFVQRGKINVFVGLEEPENAPGRYHINKRAVKEFTRQLRKLAVEMKLADDLTLRDLVLLPEVVTAQTEEVDLESAWKVMEKALRSAARQMVTMRQREGKAMQSDMKKRLKTLAGYNHIVQKRTSGAVKHYAAKLAQRIEDLLQSPARDAVRLEEEIALFADRTDITEETVRLDSHIGQFDETLGQAGAAGRRLNFILQEMNREVNTIGSKSSDFEISSTVIAMKEEVEKLREMVQNVE